MSNPKLWKKPELKQLSVERTLSGILSEFAESFTTNTEDGDVLRGARS